MADSPYDLQGGIGVFSGYIGVTLGRWRMDMVFSCLRQPDVTSSTTIVSALEIYNRRRRLYNRRRLYFTCRHRQVCRLLCTAFTILTNNLFPPFSCRHAKEDLELRVNGKVDKQAESGNGLDADANNPDFRVEVREGKQIADEELDSWLLLEPFPGAV
ncbi:MAG: hypothetical protein Q4E55_03240 [Bacteroidales bacterium]|nr:hypothetical protein [Bacteroidales bacterium]